VIKEMDTKINVYITQKQRQQLETESKETGIPMSSIVKMLLNKHYGVGKKHDN